MPKMEKKEVFDHYVRGGEATKQLLTLRQGSQSVAESGGNEVTL